MTLKIVRLATLIGVCLLLIAACSSVGIHIGDEPSYRQEPPPPERGGGPPPWAPAHGYRAKHHYRYYPPSQVYYDPGREAYFYYEGGRWQVSVSLPSSIHIDINDYVRLDMDADEPFRRGEALSSRAAEEEIKGQRQGQVGLRCRSWYLIWRISERPFDLIGQA